ncbi:hypothetical protein B0H67DRAFT_165682 [Lasiosphaeris hirsuta]|uniref:Uncharacterized protein n=1 Tax=Lasiosphaeris hirsuta TaxID=260670 RepID=A0AA40APV2_9PEZI|nr:hypothetical protein B0H67DRAFT_165682 [Lasiosphaeris hirsuta]
MAAMLASGASPHDIAKFLKRDVNEIQQRAKGHASKTTTTSAKPQSVFPSNPPPAFASKEPTGLENATGPSPPAQPAPAKTTTTPATSPQTAAILATPTTPGTPPGNHRPVRPYSPWVWSPFCGACQAEMCTDQGAYQRWLHMQDILLAYTRLYAPATMTIPGPHQSSSDARMLALLDTEYQARRWVVLSEKFREWSGRSISPEVLQRRMGY